MNYLKYSANYITYISALLQALFNFNYMFLLLLGSLACGYLLPKDYSFFITLPIALFFIGNSVIMPLTRKFIQNFGHKIAFLYAITGNILSSALAYYGLLENSLWIFLISMVSFGASHGFSTYIKFIVADTSPCCKKLNSISIVFLGGVASVLFLPYFIEKTETLLLPHLYLGSFLGLIVINISGLLLPLLMKDIDKEEMPSPKKISFKNLLNHENFISAFSAGLSAQATMTILMVMMPIVAIGCGFSQTETSHFMQMHFITMLFPLMLTPWLLKRFSLQSSVAIGLTSLFFACIMFYIGALYKQEVFFGIASLLLGFGWGHTSISSGGFLMKCYCECDAAGVQSSHEMLITLFTALLIIVSSALYHFFGIFGILGLCILFIGFSLSKMPITFKLKQQYQLT